MGIWNSIHWTVDTVFASHFNIALSKSVIGTVITKLLEIRKVFLFSDPSPSNTFDESFLRCSSSHIFQPQLVACNRCNFWPQIWKEM